MEESDKLPEEFNRALTDALEQAYDEMHAAGHPKTARMLRVVRDQVLSWQQIMVRRLAAMNVVTMPKEQREILLRMVAAEMVDQSIQEARQKERLTSLAFWSTWQAKVAIVLGVITLIVILATQLYALFFGLSHPLTTPSNP